MRSTVLLLHVQEREQMVIEAVTQVKQALLSDHKLEAGTVRLDALLPYDNSQATSRGLRMRTFAKNT